MGGPLEGVKVFEVSQIVAGPYCGVNLADLGADVVKVEPPGGEGMRLIGGFAPGESKGFHALNRGKRSLVIDLARPEGQALVHRLIPQFDVFIINSRAGVPGRLHVDYETLRALCTDLIYMENTGYGDRGPGAKRSGSDIVIQAYSGLMAGNGKVDEHGAPKQIAGTAIADYATGLAAAMGICAALYRRALSGQGEHIKTSLLSTALSVQSGSVGRLPVSDELIQRPTRDAVLALRAAGAPYGELIAARDQGARTRKAFANYYGGYRVRDGAVILGALTPLNQQQIRDVLGLSDDPMTHPDFNTLDPVWEARIDEWHDRMQAVLLTRTMDDWMAAFDQAGAPVAKVNLPEDMADDPQVVAMGYLIDLEHTKTGPEQFPGPVTWHEHYPTGSTLPAPVLGQHTEEVLTEFGLAMTEINALRVSGIIG